MTLDNEQLEKLYDLSYHCLSPEECALIMALPEDELKEAINNNYTDASKIYRKGKAQAKLDVMQKEIHFARLGSPAAVKTFIKMSNG